MSALMLRMIACIAMLLDHIGYYNGNMVLRAIGRIAFPIFAYLIVNGYRYTACRWKYALRLGIFALISQIPFSLFCTNTLSDSTGNVFVTLLIALLCVWATDVLRSHSIGRWFCWIPTIAVCLLYQLGWLDSDYGARGIVLVMAFYLSNVQKPWGKALVILGALLSVFYSHLVGVAWLLLRSGRLVLPSIGRWDWWQLFSLGALPLIVLYNGKKGRMPARTWLSKALQYAFYLFYPVHMMIIWMLNH